MPASLLRFVKQKHLSFWKYWEARQLSPFLPVPSHRKEAISDCLIGESKWSVSYPHPLPHLWLALFNQFAGRLPAERVLPVLPPWEHLQFSVVKIGSPTVTSVLYAHPVPALLVMELACWSPSDSHLSPEFLHFPEALGIFLLQRHCLSTDVHFHTGASQSTGQWPRTGWLQTGGHRCQAQESGKDSLVISVWMSILSYIERQTSVTPNSDPHPCNGEEQVSRKSVRWWKWELPLFPAGAQTLHLSSRYGLPAASTQQLLLNTEPGFSFQCRDYQPQWDFCQVDPLFFSACPASHVCLQSRV